ncbi:hypothetical protein B0T24DRAFT_637848 [Lasiosphaeria ovina]|uniref:Uncharacterized protein n=1 Tax=Lasiosphaeria ovina TaxID=92902 RepID=A0AAE0JYL9_9PEZI|nr:hypothetical protein B0T24DRAFT_637848 [Lasiosphaeria ovina]
MAGTRHFGFFQTVPSFVNSTTGGVFSFGGDRWGFQSWICMTCGILLTVWLASGFHAGPLSPKTAASFGRLGACETPLLHNRGASNLNVGGVGAWMSSWQFVSQWTPRAAVRGSSFRP